MLRMKKHKNPHTFLTRIKNSANTVENSLEVLQYIENTVDIWSSIFTSRFIFKRLDNIYIYIKSCVQMFIAISFIILKNGNDLMPINWWMDKQNMAYPYSRIVFGNKKK